MTALRTNEQRLWDSLMTMARIGATPKGGSCRLALTDADRDGRALFVSWCEDAGCTLTVDRMGNIFAQRPGHATGRAPIACGSHLDTQPHGGKFDGVFGVLAGLEAIRTLNDHDVSTEAPVEVVVWTNEEGARFAPSMIGSAVFAGTYELAFALSRRDTDGVSMGEELQRIGYAGEAECGAHTFGAFFEAHIEQGPILEREAKTIGVVTGVQGTRWYDVVVYGRDSHSGSTPMPGRRNALVGAAAMISSVDALAHAHPPDSVATVGHVEVSPNSRNTIPGRVYFTVDNRNPDEHMLDTLDRAMRERFAEIAAQAEVEVEIEEIQYTRPVVFQTDCISAVRAAARMLNLSYREMWSGAGHDSCYISQVAPTSMIFVPCAGGISHNEEESAKPRDLADGCDVLLHAILDRAGIA